MMEQSRIICYTWLPFYLPLFLLQNWRKFITLIQHLTQVNLTLTWINFHSSYLETTYKLNNAAMAEQTQTVVSWGSEATPSVTPFFKRAYKISHPTGLQASWDALPGFASSAQSVKIWLSKWIFQVKNHPNLSEFFIKE